MPPLMRRVRLERTWSRALQRAGTASQRMIIQQLGSPPDVNNLSSGFWQQVDRQYRDVLVDLLEDTYFKSAQRLARQFGYSLDDSAEYAAQLWARREASRLSVHIGHTSRNRVAAVMERYRNGGLKPSEVRAELRRIFGASRADLISETEITRTNVAGERLVTSEMSMQGIHKTPYWVTRDRPCEVCEPRDGRAQGDGWTDPPPAHPRCKCGLDYR